MASSRVRIPSIAALSAFESAARQCNFSRAAEELHTSQSAISRHIADLEARLNVRLFHRERRAVRLTEQGQHFYSAIKPNLDGLGQAVETMQQWTERELLTLACTHEISHLYVMPRFERLQQAAGDDVDVRVTTFEYDKLDTLHDPRIDIILTFGLDDAPPSALGSKGELVVREAVRPVCSPEFLERHAKTLNGPPDGWSSLPFLRLSKPNRGWATWEDWFKYSASSVPPLRAQGFDNYVYLLEAAAAGKGLALGWHGLVERHLEMGSLVGVTQCDIEFEHALFAFVSPRSHTRRSARACVDELIRCR